MVFVRLQDEIATLAPLRQEAASLRKRNIRTVDDLLSASPEDLSPWLLSVTRKLSEGTWDYAVPEQGLPLADSRGTVFWSLDNKGCLTLYGEGKVPDYTDTRRPPWEPLRERICCLRVEERVTRLGALAFRDCTALREVFLGENLRRIGTGAFRGCSSLISLTSPLPMLPLRDLELSVWPARALRFGLYAFADTPWAQRYLGEFYCSGSRLLEYHGSSRHIRIPEGITEICPMVFENLPIETVEFPESLLRIREFAFRGTALKELQLPSQLRWIGCRAFGGCRELELVCVGNRQMDSHRDAFAETPLARCGHKVNGRWPSRFAINCRPEAGMGNFLAMRAGLSDEHPLGLKNFYPRTDFINLLRGGNCLIRVEVNMDSCLVERVVAYSLDRTCGILWNEGWWDEFFPARWPDGFIDTSKHYRAHRTIAQLRRADVRGLTLSRRTFPVMWYCAPNLTENIISLVEGFLSQWLAAHPDYQLPAAQ